MGNPDSLQHTCRQGPRCKARARDVEGKHVGVGVERPDSLCRSCEQSAFASIEQLPTDYNLLRGAIFEGRSSAVGPKVSGTSTPSIPIPLSVDTLMVEIDSESLRWALRITRGDPLPAAPAQRVHACLRVIRANLGTLVDMPRQIVSAFFPHPDGGDWAGRMELDGVDAVLRLATLHHRALSVLGISETTVFLPDPCPHCDRKALAASKDQRQVTCKGCGIVWDSEHFALLSNVLDFERRAVKA